MANLGSFVQAASFRIRAITVILNSHTLSQKKETRMHSRIAIGTLLITLLSGCTAVPPLNFSVQSVEPATHKIDADLRAVSVSFAAPNEQTGDVPSDGEGIPQLWERAVVEAVNKSSVFDDESAKKVNLFVKIQELDPPAAGITMVTDASARYLLVNRKTGETLLEETITTKGVVPPGYAFAGIVRAKESVNRAVQANIRDFLARLETKKSN